MTPETESKRESFQERGKDAFNQLKNPPGIPVTLSLSLVSLLRISEMSDTDTRKWIKCYANRKKCRASSKSVLLFFFFHQSTRIEYPSYPLSSYFLLSFHSFWVRVAVHQSVASVPFLILSFGSRVQCSRERGEQTMGSPVNGFEIYSYAQSKRLLQVLFNHTLLLKNSEDSQKTKYALLIFFTYGIPDCWLGFETSDTPKSGLALNRYILLPENKICDQYIKSKEIKLNSIPCLLDFRGVSLRSFCGSSFLYFCQWRSTASGCM